MYLGDNLLQGGIHELVAAFRAERPDALILLTPVPDPENYGVAELSDGVVVRLVEKPAEPKTDLALVGVYMFTVRCTPPPERSSPSGRGELEITDAIQHLVDSGLRVEPHVVRGWWKDTGRLDDMLEANRLVLDTIESPVDGELIDSQVDGRVVIEPGARLERCVGPRPGDHRRRRSAHRLLRRSLHCDRRGVHDRERRGRALDPARRPIVRDLDGRMESSLLGRNVKIGRDQRQPRAYRFLVGDNSEIGILVSRFSPRRPATGCR